MTDRIIRLVSWNIAKKRDPWFELAEMASCGEAGPLHCLQEAGETAPRDRRAVPLRE